MELGPVRQTDERELVPREAVVLSRAEPRPAERVRSYALAILLGSVSLLFLALAVAVLLIVYQVTHVGGNLAGGIGATLQTAGQAVERIAQSAVQLVTDAADPLHPPRYAIRPDPEFDQIQMVAAGDALGTSRLYRFDLVAIEQRPEGGDPALRVYARIHRHLLVPKVTKVLGVTLRTDDDPKDYALYRGQEFGLGGHTSKVNWLSVESQSVAIARFRRAEDAEGPLVFNEP